MRQGHQVRVCVFCLQSPSRLFCDEVVVYKSVTPGSGPERRQWFISWHRARACWLIHSSHTSSPCMKWGCFRNVFIFKLYIELNITALFVLSYNVLDVCDFIFPVYIIHCRKILYFIALGSSLKLTYLSSKLHLQIFYREFVCILHPSPEWQSN